MKARFKDTGGQRPFFAEVPYYLWGEVNYDSEGDCECPTDRSWHELYVQNRDTRETLTAVADENFWTVEAPGEICTRLQLLLASRGAAEGSSVPLNWDHASALGRADRVALEFSQPVLAPFDSHMFWGSWKWIGWFGTEFTWVGRWILHSVVRRDVRAVSLCIEWLKSGTYDERQSIALRYALAHLTGETFPSDKAWVNWYEGNLYSSGAKKRYPEPDTNAWLADIKAHMASSPGS